MRESAAGPVRELALFAGAGGGILGGELLGWKTVCAVEIERDCQERLLQRQREGFLPFFPIWDDVKTFDGRPWRGCVDIVSGGFPCTDISAAGKGDGIEGAESGLWKEMARICRDVRPRYVWIENSPLLTIRGLAVVLWDIAAMGLDAEWCVVSSADAGGSSLRERIWILAYTAGEQDERKGQRGFQPESSQCYSDVANGPLIGRERAGKTREWWNRLKDGRAKGRTTAQPGLGGASHGLADWLDAFAASGRPPVAGRGPEQFPWEPPRTCKGFKDRSKRIRAIGNGQDPWALALAWKILRERAKA
jgi:DNA (cytosine-5)-methyltransferase 1